MVTLQQRLTKFDDLSIQKVKATFTGVTSTGTTGAVVNFSFANQTIDAVISIKLIEPTAPGGNATAIQAGTPNGNQVGLTLCGPANGATLSIEVIAMGR